MKHLLNWIIRLLGGIPYDNFLKAGCAFGLTKELTRVKLIRAYLDLLYGKGSDEWCRQAYIYITQMEHELEEIAEANGIEVECTITPVEDENDATTAPTV